MLTYALDSNSWDLTLDDAGDFATVSDRQQVAQDVASAIRTFQGECWYNTTLGLPYFDSILGQTPTASLLKDQLKTAALTVPTVQSVAITALQLTRRGLRGIVLVSSSQLSEPVSVSF